MQFLVTEVIVSPQMVSALQTISKLRPLGSSAGTFTKAVKGAFRRVAMTSPFIMYCTAFIPKVWAGTNFILSVCANIVFGVGDARAEDALNSFSDN